MNKYRKKLLSTIQLCSIVILISFGAAPARAQTTAPATDDMSEATGTPPFGSDARLLARPGLLLPSANVTSTSIGHGVEKAFYNAWRISGDGTNGREAVVLIFRMTDGSYTGRSQAYTNEYQKCTFKWNAAAVAIVHTHPNGTDPRPAEQDRRVADKYGVPNFTITITGMYVYDPVTRRTSKVLNGLDWLNLSAYAETVTRWLGA